MDGPRGLNWTVQSRVRNHDFCRARFARLSRQIFCREGQRIWRTTKSCTIAGQNICHDFEPSSMYETGRSKKSLKWTVSVAKSGQSKGSKVDGLKTSKWTALRNKSGVLSYWLLRDRTSIIEVDRLEEWKWTVLRNESGRSLVTITWFVEKG